MDNKRIAEGNRLMGAQMSKKFKDPFNYMYHSNWNELMGVIINLEESKEVAVFISPFKCLVLNSSGTYRHIIQSIPEDKLECVWKSLSRFLLWRANIKNFDKYDSSDCLY